MEAGGLCRFSPCFVWGGGHKVGVAKYGCCVWGGGGYQHHTHKDCCLLEHLGAYCSRSRRRAEKVDKRMVLVHTHGVFIT